MTDPALDRRTFLAGAAAGAAALPLPTALARAAAPPAGDWAFATLGESLTEERDYAPRIEGTLPLDLRGTLFRNGPGLFERGGKRKRSLLDGDGLIQAFDFQEGRARYRNRFVQTTKLREEEAAGKYLYPTWTTLAHGWLRNLPAIPKASQAGVVPLVVDGRLLALDEAGDPWELDPSTLETRGEFTLGPAGVPRDWKAHSKIDGVSGDWIVVGLSDGEYHVVVRDRRGNISEHHRAALGPMTYIHDFFATPRYVVLNLHAVSFGPKGLLLMTGLASVRDALSWTPERGNRIVVIDRSGTNPPLELEAEASWMWHSINAFDRGDEIVAEFVGYDEPDHFLGDDAALTTIMEGREGVSKAPGTLRRYVIDATRGRVKEEVLDAGNHEFPCIDPRESLQPHRTRWLCTGERGIFHDGLVRIDAEGRRDAFHFGADHQVGEPVLAQRSAGEPDWILSLVFDASSRTSSVAVFRADAIADGPVARVHLDHHAPYSFHGTWLAA